LVRHGLDGAGTGTGRIALKWPNDILADGAKLAGILLEAQKAREGRIGVVIGFGVNVVAAPEGLPYPATSLRALGAEIAAETIFAALAEEWVVAYELWDNGNNVADILRLWRASAAGMGAEVAVSQDGGVVRGIFETIDDSGRLIVRANDNSRIAISAGDVHFGLTASVRA
jgi:BirA family biotin operon repressor/biotin-[acetyl-CoA-carboxylase] ligase